MYRMISAALSSINRSWSKKVYELVDHFRNIGHRFVMLQHRLTGNYVIFKEGQDVRHLEQPIPLSEVLNDGYRMVEYLDRADETCKRENTLQSGI